MRDSIPPTETPITHGPHRAVRREHPAYAMIGAYRFTGGGFTLFGSPIRHNTGVTIRVVEASEEWDEYSGRQFGDKIVVELTLSEAQWASFVTAMNIGNGVPCTLSYRQSGAMIEVPGIEDEHPLEKRSAMIKEKAEKDMARLREFVAEYDKLLDAPGSVSKTKMRELRNLLLHSVEHAPGNYQFAADMVTEHMESTVTAARAEVEGYILQQALRFPALTHNAPEIPQLASHKKES